MTNAYIVDACRTPRGIGRIGKGSLASFHPQRLGAILLNALRVRNDIDTSSIDDVIWGCSNQQWKQGGDLGRMSALDAGYDVRASGVTLDRFCGSGLTAVSFGSAMIMAGMEDVIIAGGTELMSHNAAEPEAKRPSLFDAGNLHLRALHPQVAQGICADAVATLEKISREATEELSLESQKRAQHAIVNGHFSKSIVQIHSDDGSLALATEEVPRPGTTLEDLAKLRPSFEAMADQPIDGSGLTHRDLLKRAFPDLNINHIHHAGNSSGVADASAAVLLASKSACAKNGWAPRARIVAMANVGDSPELMLNGPVPATRKVLDKAGLKLNDIDLFEVNEAFAVVTEKYIRDLNLDRSKINVNGGAIALGHPIGATGAILVGTLLDELERRDMRYGLATMCAAGGMAPAIIIERL
ncbi:MAG: acetyl-CoA C-acetyltransferase [Parvibaculaceae bacterium]